MSFIFASPTQSEVWGFSGVGPTTDLFFPAVIYRMRLMEIMAMYTHCPSPSAVRRAPHTADC